MLSRGPIFSYLLGDVVSADSFRCHSLIRAGTNSFLISMKKGSAQIE